MKPTINSWSFSRIMDFESCKFRAYLKYAMRIPEPQRPLREGQTEHANDRGTRIHSSAEHYINGTRDDLVHELRHYAPELNHLRTLFKHGQVALEGEWGYDRDWAPTEWKKAWHRSKLDIITFASPYEAVVTDIKTGKRFGNEIKHAQQVQLYTVDALLMHPDLERVTTELWYTDHDEMTSMSFTRQQGLRFKDNFDRRGRTMTDAVDFPPNPNMHTCRYCEYGPWNSNDCTVGVRQTFQGIPIKKK